jgi:outer membrane immunogenic protein
MVFIHRQRVFWNVDDNSLVARACSSSSPRSRVLTAAPPPPLAAPVYNWTGFYVGAHFGGGWARESWEERGNAFGNICHDIERRDDVQLETVDGFGFDIFPVCPFATLSEAPGSSFGQNAFVGSHNAIGPLGGFQAGFNWQPVGTHWVFGIEGQFSFADLKGDHQNSISGAAEQGFIGSILGVPIISINTQGAINDRFSSRVTDIATIAGRIGITSDVFDRTMFYVKGGAAWKRNELDVTSQFSASSCGLVLVFALPCDTTVGSGSWSGRESRWGWMAGVGLEFGLFDNWSAKIEYDYLGFGHHDVTLAGGLTATCTGFICGFPETFGPTVQSVGNSRTFSINENIQVVKLGLNYRFGWWGKGKAPVVASY